MGKAGGRRGVHVAVPWPIMRVAARCAAIRASRSSKRRKNEETAPVRRRPARRRLPGGLGELRCAREVGRESGKLDARTRRLLKLALAVGAGSEGAVHSHARQAREEGIADGDIRQVVLLAITTLGFPAAMAAYSWVNDILAPESADPAQKP